HPVTPDMVFDMGSAGKTLAAALMLDLAEEGLIDLDDPIDAYIDPPPGVDGSIPTRTLLNHTSGLANPVEHPDSPFRIPYHLIDFERWWEIDELFTELGAAPYFQPGEGWHYSQAGYQVATLIVEDVTGRTMAENIQSRLLDPLEIHGMMLDFSQPLPERIVIAHNWVDLKGYGIPEDVSDRSRSWIASFSRILTYTTAEDFARWGQALYTGQVLEPESLNEMLDFVEITDFGSEPPIFTGYGLGVVEWIPEMLNGHYGYGHSGSIPGYRAFMAYLPESGLTIAVLSNTDKEGELGVLINALLEVALSGQTPQAAPGQHDFEPSRSVPAGEQAVDVFSDQLLFCDHDTSWQIATGSDRWIDLSLDWIVADSPELAEEVWRYHSHRISINGTALENYEEFAHPVIHSRVDCPEESLDLYARGFSIFLPPLEPGKYQIVWRSDVTGKFNNGFVDYQAGDYLEAQALLDVSPP
ncbi:MAG: serine hydrolase domain-containing protein, partial [Anaerolineales bacterium]